MSSKTAFPIDSLAAVKPFQLDPESARKIERETTPDSLFEHFAWLYIFCREKLFRDDTARMIGALWPAGEPAPGEEIIELGCGPGFYSSGLAKRFPNNSVVGVDRSPRQINRAREKTAALGLNNCRFESDNV